MVPSSQRYYITIKRTVAPSPLPPSPPFPFLLSEVSLPLLTSHSHPFFLFFTRTPLSSNLFLMSDLARQDVKPRLFRFSQRYFASTPMLMFFLLRSKRLSFLALPFLLEIHVSSAWTSLFLLHMFALTFLFLARARLSPTLTFSH